MAAEEKVVGGAVGKAEAVIFKAEGGVQKLGDVNRAEAAAFKVE